MTQLPSKWLLSTATRQTKARLARAFFTSLQDESDKIYLLRRPLLTRPYHRQHIGILAPLVNYETLSDMFGPSSNKNLNSRRKMARRDIYQRKAYAVRRMSLAVIRLSRATSQTEKDKASYWAKMWGTVSGIRQFRLGNTAAATGTAATGANLGPWSTAYPKRFDPL
jgi:hypothetical protein